MSEPVNPKLPLSIVLGAGGIRGMAHIGVLEVLNERGYFITEMVGSSVGALILGYYAAVGLDLPMLRQLGLGLTTRHLLAWAALRRTPDCVRRRFQDQAGIIPEYLDRLAKTSGKNLHHGVARIGMVAFDLIRGQEVLFHNQQPHFPLENAVRGSVCIPGLFPPRACRLGNLSMRLVDGGITNPLPINVLFQPPFQPVQILIVDVSNRSSQRLAHLAGLETLRRRHPHIPIGAILPATLGHSTIIYRTPDVQRRIDLGRQAAEEKLSKV